MTLPQPAGIVEAMKAEKSDWKSIAALLLALLTATGSFTWFLSSRALAGAVTEIQDNSKRMGAIEIEHVSVKAQIESYSKRQEEILLEVKEMNKRVGSMSESQARMEGIISAGLRNK